MPKFLSPARGRIENANRSDGDAKRGNFLAVRRAEPPPRRVWGSGNTS
jgi:hypothetical protein